MVIHHQAGQLRRNSDQPTAITNLLVATSGSSQRTGDIQLAIPTCSARSRHGRWALYPNGAQVVVVWPGGAIARPPTEVAGELDRLRGDGHDDLDRAAVGAIRQFLTDPTDPDGQHAATRWLAATRARTWSSPAIGYWLSGPFNQPSHDHMPSSWPGAPARLAYLPIPLPDPSPEPAPAQAA
jgi:hypothetical protein